MLNPQKVPKVLYIESLTSQFQLYIPFSNPGVHNRGAAITNDGFVRPGLEPGTSWHLIRIFSKKISFPTCSTEIVHLRPCFNIPFDWCLGVSCSIYVQGMALS